MELYSFTNENVTYIANVALKSTVEGMVNEGFISEKNAKNFIENYALIVYKKGIFNSIFEGDFFKKHTNSLCVKLIKQIGDKNDGKN